MSKNSYFMQTFQWKVQKDEDGQSCCHARVNIVKDRIHGYFSRGYILFNLSFHFKNYDCVS